MYLVKLKSALTEALQKTFNSRYPVEDLRNINVTIEFPNQRQNYPCIFLTYEDTEPLTRAGINHREVVQDTSGTHEVTRWRFGGSLSLTVGAFTSLERDRIFDELVRVLAFSGVDSASIFKTLIENNDFLGINPQYDVLNSSGDAANPGTPWGTQDEIIYERTLSTDLIGEFVSDPETNDLVNLSDVKVEGYVSGTPTPDFPDLEAITNRPFSPTEWH